MRKREIGTVVNTANHRIPLAMMVEAVSYASLLTHLQVIIKVIKEGIETNIDSACEGVEFNATVYYNVSQSIAVD